MVSRRRPGGLIAEVESEAHASSLRPIGSRDRRAPRVARGSHQGSRPGPARLRHRRRSGACRSGAPPPPSTHAPAAARHASTTVDAAASSVIVMQQRPLGRSGLLVSRFALGTMTWGADTDPDDAAAQLKTYVDVGGNLLDTADVYADGVAEEVVGALLST